MPAANASKQPPEPFLIGQPVWWLQSDHPNVRWAKGIEENDPTGEEDDAMPARRGVEIQEHESDEPDGVESDAEDGKERKARGKWVPIERAVMLQHAGSKSEDWRRVALVCGAGLGKTTNLRWLEARLNRWLGGRAPDLAIFMELRELVGDPDRVFEQVDQWFKDHRATGSVAQRRFAVERMLKQGRATFLLDSLDQANPDPSSPAVSALRSLATGRWWNCRIWISGRPYAFRTAREKLQAMAGNTPWQFLRIGPLHEPECRQLLEISRRPFA